MKLFLSILYLCSFTISFSQMNDSPISAYEWKGKKTTLSSGYVILNSGKKLEGKISLERENNKGNISGIYFEGDDKEINFPLAAIKSYGLNGVNNSEGSIKGYYSGPIVCDNNEDLFTWRDMGVQMGKQINNTKPRSGYVIKRDGTLIEGDLQIKKVDDQFDEFVVKSKSGKFKILAKDVGHYGLQMVVSELTKNGEKNYSDEAKNFHQGKIVLKNGNQLEGLIAFKKKEPINPNRPGVGSKYTGMYFAKDATSFVKSYSGEEVISIEQTISGEKVVYSPYEGGFVSSTTMDNARYADKSKAFNEGTITLVGGESKTGEVAKPNRKKINFRTTEGIISAYEPNQIDKIEVKIEGENLVFINIDGFFVEEIINGNTFWVYENPTPTTVNQKKTNMANNMASLGTSLASSAVLNLTEKSMGTDMNLDSIVRTSSTEDIEKAREDMAKMYGFQSVEEMEEKGIPDENASNLDAALQLELASRQNNDEIVIYYDETIVINKNTKKKTILYKDKDLMNDKLEGLLMGCYSFLELDKKEQKQYYDIDNIRRTFKMLNECY